MATKRLPLASNPNAVNSPLRSAAHLASKRPRPAAADARADVFDVEQPPTKKRQTSDTVASAHTNSTLRRTQLVATLDQDARIFETRREHATTNNAFQRKLLASREAQLRLETRGSIRSTVEQNQHPHQPQQHKQIQEAERPRRVDKKELKTWRQHYLKQFPAFVFYFEGMPQETSNRFRRAVTHLGAREEKFFSLHVTHVITTRPVPDDVLTTSSSHVPRQEYSQTLAAQSRTINPSLLDKHNDQALRPTQSKTRPTFDSLPQRRIQTSHADVLVKAKDMGKKIWSAEKFDRVLDNLLRLDSDEAEASRKPQPKPTNPNQDLSRLLQNEKQVPSDRPPWSDIVPFRHFFIYIHDVEERLRPVMVREYKRCERDKDGNISGDWPQLNSVREPKCPFVPDSTSHRNDETERESQAQEEGGNDLEVAQPPRASTAPPEGQALEPRQRAFATTEARKRPSEIEPPRQMGARPAQPQPPHARHFEPPTLKHYSTNQSNTTDSLPPQNRFQFLGMPRTNPGREPLASGLQQSNQTSAIRSQMISSTADKPGARRAVSKEMHDLQKRAFEQRRGISSSANDLRAAINAPASAQGAETRVRHAKALQKIQEDEETLADDVEGLSPKTQEAQKKVSEAKTKAKLKPGYCENCRDKYDSFKEHIQERKHRAFAMKAENWTELDALLEHLVRR